MRVTSHKGVVEDEEEKMEWRWVAMVVLPLDEGPLRPMMRERGMESGGEDGKGMGGGLVIWW